MIAVVAAGLALGGGAASPAFGAQGKQGAAQRAYDAGLRGFVHGYAPVLHRLSQEVFPLNQLVSINALTTPRDRMVVLPNVDTAYTVGKLDLRGGPMVLRVPDHGRRYFVFQVMDAYTDVAGYVGTRTTGTGPGDYAIVGPGQSAPPGMPAVRVRTMDALLLGRTLVEDAADLPQVRALLERYALAPVGTAPVPSLVLDERPQRPRPELPRGLAFFDLFDAILAEDPPSVAEARALAPLRRYGIGAGLQATTTPMAPAIRRALERAVAAGEDHVRALAAAQQRRSVAANEGWTLLDPDTGDTGTDYELRAVVALIGLWANTPAEATYPMAAEDEHGRPLDGRHRYALTFDRPPPARAFWSLTMYDRNRFLVDNPLDRYALGDRTPGLRVGRDGSVTVRLQHRRPRDGATNWLPAPRGRFLVSLRLYVPRSAALDGGWSPPGIRCLDCPSHSATTR